MPTTSDPVEFPSACPLSSFYDHCETVHSPVHSTHLEHERSDSTPSTEYTPEVDDSDPPAPNETPEQTLTRLVDMLCTIEFEQMEAYYPEYKVNIGEAYERIDDEEYTHIMFANDFVWLNIHNTNDSDNTPRFLKKEIVYEICASYFIDCCLNGTMRYTLYPDGTISYWVRLDLQTTRLMRKVLQKSRMGIRSHLMTELLEDLVDDIVDAIEKVEPLRIYIIKVFLGRR